MEEMKTLKEAAYNWLCERPAVKWSRSHFTTHCKCDMLLNNICECFNSNILGVRDKPIITMLEKIRINLMERIHKKRDKMKKYEGLICPAIQAIVEGYKSEAACWIPRWNGDQKFEVVSPYGEQLRVDIGERTCGCRKWKLTGIPCQHAISALNYLGEEPEKFVSHYYLRGTFLKTYNNLLNPVNGKELWRETELTPVQPPNYTRQPGRPKRNRNKKKDEKKANPHKLGKKGVSMSCSLCGSTDHNKRRCPKKDATESTIVQVRTKRGSRSLNATSATLPRSKLAVRGKGAVSTGFTTSTVSAGQQGSFMWHGRKVFRKNGP